MGVLERVSREIRTLRGFVRILRATIAITRTPTRVFPDVLDDLVETYGGRTALICDRETLSYAALGRRVNQYARWARSLGIGKGHCVALLMPNCADYLAIWLGITKAGGAVALLNTNLMGAALSHCINVVRPRQIIVDSTMLPQFETARPGLTVDPGLWVAGEETHGHAGLAAAVARMDGATLAKDERPALTLNDDALFIFTSGTTGMPKAARFNHYRLMATSHGFAAFMDLTPQDRMLDVLPMYHSNGGVLATLAPLVRGASVAIRERFSAREFWADAVRLECTAFFYIGELCRYLVNTPTHPAETKHRIRLVCGNGLRPDVWPMFRRRFGISEIREFYAATEGNVALLNIDSTQGAVGRLPWYAQRRFVVKLVRFDVEREEPVRGPNGLCIECGVDEVGECLGEVLNDPRRPANRFDGYADPTATERKILRDVFRKGDAWFRTGDLMRRDAANYYYFIDRIGDTFRWKGENVATSEVQEAITVFPGVVDCTVYGVSVPGQDGRAGMAALVVEDDFDLNSFRDHLATQLPDYARPLFLRLQRELEVTGTFKQRKVELVRDGFDPTEIDDPLFFSDARAHRFVPLDAALHAEIVTGAVRL